MILINCPQEFNEHNVLIEDGPTVFLAGGITNCPDWQKEMIEKLKNDNVILFNPRRGERFDANDHAAHVFQVNWEFRHLHEAEVVSFWFPKETLCPITLFELGAACERFKLKGEKFVIGVHPEYQKLETVTYQLKDYGFDGKVATTLDELAEQIRSL